MTILEHDSIGWRSVCSCRGRQIAKRAHRGSAYEERTSCDSAHLYTIFIWMTRMIW
jgi:hypothetical protein